MLDGSEGSGWRLPGREKTGWVSPSLPPLSLAWSLPSPFPSLPSLCLPFLFSLLFHLLPLCPALPFSITKPTAHHRFFHDSLLASGSGNAACLSVSGTGRLLLLLTLRLLHATLYGFYHQVIHVKICLCFFNWILHLLQV